MNKCKSLLIGGIVVVMILGLVTFAGAFRTVAPLMAAEEFREPLGLFSHQPVGLWVTGEGKVMATPDVAIFNLGIEAEAKTVAEAQRQAAEAMNRVMKALTEHGVLKKDVQTQQYTIHPIRRWIDEEIIPVPPRPFPKKWIEKREEIIGYRVTNMITAKIREIDKAGVIIDATVKAGGDLIRIRDINFTVDDPLPYYQEAREKAVRDAVAKAKQITTVAGIKLGKPTYISEFAAYIPPPLPFKAFLERVTPPVPPPTTITPGELEIKVKVQIVYRIG